MARCGDELLGKAAGIRSSAKRVPYVHAVVAAMKAYVAVGRPGRTRG
jgi:hypothetical protein